MFPNVSVKLMMWITERIGMALRAETEPTFPRPVLRGRLPCPLGSAMEQRLSIDRTWSSSSGFPSPAVSCTCFHLFLRLLVLVLSFWDEGLNAGCPEVKRRAHRMKRSPAEGLW